MKAYFQTLSVGASVLASQRNIIAGSSRGRSPHRSVVLVMFMVVASTARAATNDLAGALQRGLFEEEANRNLDAAVQAYQAVSTQFDKDRALAATAIFRLGEVYRKQNKTNEAVVQYERVVREFVDQSTLVTLSRQNLAGLRSSPQLTSAVSVNASELNSDAQLLAKLKALSRAELRDVLPGISNDRALSDLIQQLDAADLQFRSRANDVTENHPEYKRIIATQKVLNEKIDARINGILKGMEIRSRAQVANTPATTAATLSPASRAQLLQLLQEEVALVEQKLETQRRGRSSGQYSQADILTTQQELLALKRQLVAVADDSAAGGSAPAGKDSTASEVSNYEEQELRRLQTLIQNSPDLINGAVGAESPLYRAAGAGQLRVAAFLLDNGADANRASLGRMPLHNAVQFGHKGMVELLLQRGANVEAKDNTGGTALHLAAQNGFLSIAEALLKYKADLNARNSQQNNGQTPLHAAVQGGHRVMSEFLVERGADVNATSSGGASPLFTAVSYDHPGLLARLLASGAKPDLENNSGRTALSYAAERGQLESVKALLAAKTDPNAGRNNLPLHRAIQSRNPAIVEALLRAGADANRVAPVSSGRPPTPGGGDNGDYTGTPLEAAIRENNAALVKLLLQFKADPNGPSSTGEPMVVRVAKDPPLLKLLLEAGANPNAVRPNFDGATSALHYAVNAPPNSEAAKLLLEHGAKPNATARHGQHGVTPLMLAANGKDAALVQLLLDHKADPNLRDVAGNTALLNAVRGQAVDVVRALLAAGANPDVTTENDYPGYPALMLAVTDAANREVAVALLAAKANVNAPDPNGKTPLHWAVEKKRTDLMELLLKAGADVNLRDKSGLTPLDYVKQTSPSPRPVGTAMLPTPAAIPGRVVSPATGTRPAEATAADVAALLRQHGALDELPRLDRIEVRRGDYSAVVFWRGTNDWNQHTLLELIAVESGLLAARRESAHYAYTETNYFRPWQVKNERRLVTGLQFPDFRNVIIHRPTTDGLARETLKVDLEAMLRSGDCKRDVSLAWGDVVEIAETDHPIDEWWTFSTEALKTLKECLTRKVTISVKDQTMSFTLAPLLTLEDGALKTMASCRRFGLLPVLDESKLLRSSSDLSRIKVTRRDGASGQTRELVVNKEIIPDLWLRDGDVIEVPDKL